jgi:hypothetical protein
MAYFVAENTGEGFITHEDNELSQIFGYPANIWITENRTWAERVGAIEKTKEEAQALVDAEIEGITIAAEMPNAGQKLVITLP